MPTRALRIAASGMYAQQLNIQIISNNIANVNTSGFKKNKAEFKDMIYQEVATNPVNSYLPGVLENSNDKVQVGNGVQLASTQKIFVQGDLTATNNKLDIAIFGEGFFQVKRPDGTFAYTRDGSLKISSDGSIVNASGHVLDPGIKLNSDVQSIQISKDGQITASEVSGDSIELGNIELAKFINPAGLTAIGDNLFIETKASGPPILGTPGVNGFGELHQGFVETSNVDIVEEMVAMITAQRAYEINSKTVKTVEDMMSMANNLKRS